MSAAQQLELMQQLVPTVTVEEVGARFAKEFDPSAVAVIAILPSSVNVPTESALLELATKALSVKPEREVVAERATKLMESLPQAGEYHRAERASVLRCLVGVALEQHARPLSPHGHSQERCHGPHFADRWRVARDGRQSWRDSGRHDCLGAARDNAPVVCRYPQPDDRQEDLGARRIDGGGGRADVAAAAWEVETPIRSR